MEFYFERDYYYVVVAGVLFTLFCIRRLIGSEFGVTLQAMRDDEPGAQSIGINPSSYKLAVFTISAFFAGFAGGLFAHFARLVSPELLALHNTFDILTMAMIGGLGTIAGPILGAVSLTILSEALRSMEEVIKNRHSPDRLRPAFDPHHPVHARRPGWASSRTPGPE